MPNSTLVSVTGGKPLRVTYNVKDANDAAVDLTGRDLDAQWRAFADQDRVLDFAIDASGAATGTIIITLTAAQTLTMDGDGEFDLRISTGGIPEYYGYRQTSWSLGVTRD